MARCAISFLGISMVVSMGEVFSEAAILSMEITEGMYPLFLCCFKAFKAPMAVLSLAQKMAEGRFFVECMMERIMSNPSSIV